MIVIGLMSGTSMDGVDVALLDVREVPDTPANPAWEVLSFQTYPFVSSEREKILDVLSSGGVRELALLHTELGNRFADAVLSVLDEVGIRPGAISAIGSHGQTMWHEPPVGEERGTSFQLGCPATLAERTGIGVVSDFRSRDLAAGGHGAPLVPWPDRVFFSSPMGSRAIQNLGGMANVTWLPRVGDSAPVLAFDTGPGVALLDGAVEMATHGEMAFDQDGQIAERGTVLIPVLERLLNHPFFSQTPPRSTGRELFGLPFLRELVVAVRADGLKLETGRPQEGWPHLLATLTALTARSIGEAYRRWVLPKGVDELFLMGGGSLNPVLFRAIAEELSPLEVQSGVALGMNPESREAAAFALLAWAHLQGLPANVPEATGSKGPRVLGSWTPGGMGGVA